MSDREIAERNYARVNQAQPPAQLSPVSQMAMDFVFGRVWESPELSWRERRIASLACIAVSGQTMPLEAHVRAAIASGDLSVDELRALAVHLAAYAGFPVGATFETTVRKVAEAQEQGS